MALLRSISTYGASWCSSIAGRTRPEPEGRTSWDGTEVPVSVDALIHESRTYSVLSRPHTYTQGGGGVTIFLGVVGAGAAGVVTLGLGSVADGGVVAVFLGVVSAGTA